MFHSHSFNLESKSCQQKADLFYQPNWLVSARVELEMKAGAASSDSSRVNADESWKPSWWERRHSSLRLFLLCLLGQMQRETTKSPRIRLAVACGFCNKSIFPLSKNDPPQYRHVQIPTNLAASPPSPISQAAWKNVQAQTDSCICNKPRNRCCFCLNRLNSSSTLRMFQPSFKIDRNDVGKPVVKRVTHPFAAFTVFCATCRHSGHATHYLNWFKTNSTCPVGGCTCSCAAIDASLKGESGWVQTTCSFSGNYTRICYYLFHLRDLFVSWKSP